MSRHTFTTTLLTFLVLMCWAGIALAEEQAGGAGGDGLGSGLIAVGAGLGIGLAAFGGGLGQGRATSAALDGIARNPEAAARIQTPMILGLALIESLVIYALLIGLLLQAKIPAAG